MVTISLCMIVKDEEALLPRCLESIQGLVEEVIVVDTGSSDRTVELAQQAGAQVYHFPWVGDFSQARNFSFSKATQQYCLWMDADDVLDAQYRSGFLQLKAALPPQTDVVMLPYHTAFDQAGAPTFTYYRERLIRRLAGLRWSGAVHEAIPPVGNVVYWDKAAISHRKPGPGDPDRNLAAAQWEEYLASGEGWVENQREACRDLSACYLRQGKGEEAFRALAKALRLGPPRAELCCDFGAFFLERGDYPAAAFWYEAARPREDRSGAFVSPDCYGYLPCIQLCVCYYRMGDVERSQEYNRRAGQYKPQDPAFLYNQRFFQGKGEALS